MGDSQHNGQGMMRLFTFTAEGRSYALPLDDVEHVLRAVEVRPLPESPYAVRGVIDIHGEVRPVVDVRRRLGLPESPITPETQFIVTSTTPTVVLMVDEVVGIIDVPEAADPALDSVSRDTSCVDRIVHVDGADDMVFVLDALRLTDMRDGFLDTHLPDRLGDPR
jgi:purine-binding chemotaxis protein CheW